MKELPALTVKEFLSLTLSDAPAPGGGSAAALFGALGAALAGMVANLTAGEKYAAVAEEMRSVAQKAETLCGKLTESVQKDTESFSEYMAALKLPKEPETAALHRKEAMQRGLKTAALVPLETAKTALEVLPLAKAAVKSGNKNALSDGLVAAMAARTAVLGAVLNVRINLAGIKDETFVREVAAEADETAARAIALEREILRLAEISESFAK